MRVRVASDHEPVEGMCVLCVPVGLIIPLRIVLKLVLCVSTLRSGFDF